MAGLGFALMKPGLYNKFVEGEKRCRNAEIGWSTESG